MTATYLSESAFHGNIDVVKAALEAGAKVNGPPQQPCPPTATATITNRVGMVDFLLDQGADPNKPVTIDFTAAKPGEHALHVAARTGKVEIVRLLLKQSRVDPAATDYARRTPLMATCESSRDVEIVQLLLKAGADPPMARLDGYISLCTR